MLCCDFYSQSQFIYITPMPPKIQRYVTEPKKEAKFVARTSQKMTSMTKDVGKKVIDFKRFTVSSTQDRHISIFEEFQCKSSLLHSSKKKSFVVTRRKTNKSILEEAIHKNPKKCESQWIEQVQFQSYQGVRDYNEDRILVKQNILVNNQILNVYAVFDGHGGSTASQYLKSNFAKVFEGFVESHTVQDSLRKTISELEMRILKNGLKIGSGSCATILVTKENEYWAANVGDSRILFVKGMEQFVQVTEDHKPENAKQYRRIENLGGKVYRNLIIDENTGQKSYGPFRVMPSRLSVTRAVGDFLIKKNQTQNLIICQPQIYSGQLEPETVILLFSDGAYEQFSNNELSILFSHKTKQPLKQRLSNFMSSAKKRNTNDNTSIIAIQVARGKSAETSASSTVQPSFSNIQIKL